MNKKRISLIILLFFVIIGVMICVICFTDFGAEIRTSIYDKIMLPKEKVIINENKNLKVTYTYRWNEEAFSIELNDAELNDMIIKEIHNKNLVNYSSEIGLYIVGEYTVYLEDDLYFKFDGYEDDGYVRLYDNERNFLTKIDPEILSRVVEIVDVKLTENIQMFKTEKITVFDENNKQLNIEGKAIIEYILDLCKNLYTKDLDERVNVENPDYKMDFNNGIQIYKYASKDEGYLIKNNIVYELYGTEVLGNILKNTFKTSEEWSKKLKTDRITIVTPKNTVEITDEIIVDKITSSLIYSTILDDREWLETYDISEEYETGTKIRMNNYEFLIPGIKFIGNRYLISEDGKITLCFPLIDLEKYINQLGIN